MKRQVCDGGDTHMRMTMLTVNCGQGGLAGKAGVIAALGHETQADIICLGETHLRAAGMPRVDGYNVIASARVFRDKGQRKGGVAVAVRVGWTVQQTVIVGECELCDAMTVRVHVEELETPVHVVVVYLPPDDVRYVCACSNVGCSKANVDAGLGFIKDTVRVMTGPVLVTGDMNANVQSNSKRWRTIKQQLMAEGVDLCLHNPTVAGATAGGAGAGRELLPTRENPAAVLDLVLANEHDGEVTVSVMVDAGISDHHVLITQCVWPRKYLGGGGGGDWVGRTGGGPVPVVLTQKPVAWTSKSWRGKLMQEPNPDRTRTTLGEEVLARVRQCEPRSVGTSVLEAVNVLNRAVSTAVGKGMWQQQSKGDQLRDQHTGDARITSDMIRVAGNNMRAEMAAVRREGGDTAAVWARHKLVIKPLEHRRKAEDRVAEQREVRADIASGDYRLAARAKSKLISGNRSAAAGRSTHDRASEVVDRIGRSLYTKF